MLLALYLGRKRNLDNQQYEQILTELEKIPSLIEQILDQTDAIKSIAEELSAYKDYFFLGRHYHVPIATESSLKFKEITYLHSEAYPAGELKHGPLALIDEKIPTIVFVPHDAMYEKNLSTIQEVKARKGKILSISDQEIVSDRHITIPETIEALYPFLGAVVGQLLSYYTADHLGKDIDKPRNLAKSVTVK
ncbi:SIS domain-containing protein [Patescibacteria group bacterium]|nr:SIS domain-containing protein [Patescibacteria group bacterium]MBP7842175.1 SIS domain-containing protein [Patescibacteria group bacterium]